MTFREKIRSGKFLITSEIAPPKGIDIQDLLRAIEFARGRVDAVNVTDLQSAVMRLGALAVAKSIKDKGIEPIFQITCRDRNRMSLQSELLSAAFFGIDNILALTGDYPTSGDHPEAKPVYDLDSVTLLQAAHSLTLGKDMNGNSLKGTPAFCLGAVVNPGADPIEPEIIKMEKKIEAGAQFFQTQAVFDIGAFENFVSKVRHLNTTILAGVIVLKSAAMARYLNRHVAGVTVPEEFIREMEGAADRVSVSVRIASDLIKGLKPISRGVHIMPIGWDDKLPLILDAAGI